MRSRCGQTAWFVLFGATVFVSTPASAQIWKNFVPTSRSAAPADSRSQRPPTNSNSEWATDIQSSNQPTDQRQPRGGSESRRQTADVNSDAYAITQDSGPWLIVAASFSGSGSEQQARNLATELRERFHLHAYVHEMDF